MRVALISLQSWRSGAPLVQARKVYSQAVRLWCAVAVRQMSASLVHHVAHGFTRVERAAKHHTVCVGVRRWCTSPRCVSYPSEAPRCVSGAPHQTQPPDGVARHPVKFIPVRRSVCRQPKHGQRCQYAHRKCTRQGWIAKGYRFGVPIVYSALHIAVPYNTSRRARRCHVVAEQARGVCQIAIHSFGPHDKMASPRVADVLCSVAHVRVFACKRVATICSPRQQTFKFGRAYTARIYAAPYLGVVRVTDKARLIVGRNARLSFSAFCSWQLVA